MMIKYLDSSKLSDEEVEKEFESLLKRLPNNGKLYKYRSFQKGNFERAYDSLFYNYLWFSAPMHMNDKIDTTLNIDLKREAKRIEQTFLTCKEKYLTTVLKKFFKDNKLPYCFTNETIKQISNCFFKSGKMNKTRAKCLMFQNGVSHDKIRPYTQKILELIENQIGNYEKKVKKLAKPFININERLRKKLAIYCMAERYDIDSMWAYYGSSNSGFCIEYDFLNAKLTIKQKRALLNLFEIKYKKRRERFSFIPHIERWLESGDVDTFEDCLMQDMCKQLLIKNPSWKHEREWRIMGTLKKNKFMIDVVSGVYIDEDMLEAEYGKILIKLAKERNWNIYNRCLNRYGTAFIYKNLACI